MSSFLKAVSIRFRRSVRNYDKSLKKNDFAMGAKFLNFLFLSRACRKENSIIALFENVSIPCLGCVFVCRKKIIYSCKRVGGNINKYPSGCQHNVFILS